MLDLILLDVKNINNSIYAYPSQHICNDVTIYYLLFLFTAQDVCLLYDSMTIN